MLGFYFQPTSFQFLQFEYCKLCNLSVFPGRLEPLEVNWKLQLSTGVLLNWLPLGVHFMSLFGNYLRQIIGRRDCWVAEVYTWISSFMLYFFPLRGGGLVWCWGETRSLGSLTCFNKLFIIFHHAGCCKEQNVLFMLLYCVYICFSDSRDCFQGGNNWPCYQRAVRWEGKCLYLHNFFHFISSLTIYFWTFLKLNKPINPHFFAKFTGHHTTSYEGASCGTSELLGALDWLTFNKSHFLKVYITSLSFCFI